MGTRIPAWCLSDCKLTDQNAYGMPDGCQSGCWPLAGSQFGNGGIRITNPGGTTLLSIVALPAPMPPRM
jgi:hypothetical protein